MNILNYLFPHRIRKNKDGINVWNDGIPVGYSLFYALDVLQKAYSCKYIDDEYKEIEY